MKKQLVTSVSLAFVGFIDPELMVIGEVFYMRRTKILKRLVRRIIHKVEIPAGSFISVEKAKTEARRRIDEFVKQYYKAV